MLTVSALLAASANAATTTIDFEGLAAMNFNSGNPVPVAARLSTQLLSSYGVAFSSGDPYVAVVELGAGHATSGVNGLGGAIGGVLTYDRAFPIAIEFFDPADPTVKATTDFVSIRADLAGWGESITLEAFDLLGTKIGETTLSDSGGPLLSLSLSGIHSVRFLGTHDFGGAALDDLSFGTLTPISSVPEPATAVLLGLGLAGLAATRSRRH